MTRQQQSPKQAAREQRRSDRNTNDHPDLQQGFGTRTMQRGTERNETQSEGGRRRNDAGDIDDGSRSDHEQGDERRPYKRAGR